MITFQLFNAGADSVKVVLNSSQHIPPGTLSSNTTAGGMPDEPPLLKFPAG
jgi:hypothetical protein